MTEYRPLCLYEGIVEELHGGDTIPMAVTVGNNALNVITNPNFDTWTGLTDLVVNGGFETGNPPTGWNTLGDGAVLTQDATKYKAGSYSAKLTRAGADCLLYRTVAASPNTRYVVSAWVWASQANAAGVAIYDGTNTVLSDSHPGDSQWHYLSAAIQTSATASSIAIYGHVCSYDTSAYFDSMVAYAMLTPTDWSKYEVYVFREEDKILTGLYSLGVECKTIGGGVSQGITDYGDYDIYYWRGRTVVFGCWVYATDANFARLCLWDGLTGNYSEYHSGTPGWEFLTVTMTISATATEVSCHCQVTSVNNAQAWFAGAQCIEVGQLLLMARAQEPTTQLGDIVQLFAAESSDGDATLGMVTEQDTEAIGTFTLSHKLKIKINGTEYYIGLDAV